MAILPILEYPDPRLHRIAAPVATVDESVKTLIGDLADTMYAAPGVGLAATQCDVHQRVIVIDVSDTRDQLLALVNPVILRADGEQLFEEGCLSVPGVYEEVKRAEHVLVEALDREGQRFTLEASGLLAVCIQHEMDHLMGKVFVEHLSPLKRNRAVQKLRKRRRERADA
ncbi:MAG: peptide deformylase [Rhodocyclaceae bacterium]|nr:peptide deformylase [Rhodocyclaceae bacterium]